MNTDAEEEAPTIAWLSGCKVDIGEISIEHAQKRDPQAQARLHWFKKTSFLYGLSKTAERRDQFRCRDLSIADLANTCSPIPGH